MNYKRATFLPFLHEKTLNSAEGNKKRCVEIERKISAAESYFNFRFLFRLAQKSRQSGLSKSEKSLAKKNATFRKSLILVFVNENCCLCKCFTELYLFYWSLVASRAILNALQFIFSRSWTSLAGVLKMLRISIYLPVSRDSFVRRLLKTEGKICQESDRIWPVGAVGRKMFPYRICGKIVKCIQQFP